MPFLVSVLDRDSDMGKSEFTKIEGNHSLKPCPFCGHDAELWDHEISEGIFVKVAMCTNSGDGFGYQNCPMYMPNEGFYKSTKREAITIWNTRDPKINTQ